MPFAKQFFSEKEQHLIVEAIKNAELKTSGEIRVHIENFCFGNELKRAQKVFGKLKMHQTKERNGILIYIASQSKKIAVTGDKGIHEKLGNSYWEKLIQNLIIEFKANNRGQALANCIVDLGKQLGDFFPRQDDDVNELSNSISF